MKPWSDTNPFNQPVDLTPTLWPLVGNYSTIHVYLADYAKALAREAAYSKLIN